MFWLLAFGAAGGAFLLVDTFALAIAAVVLLAPILVAIMWINERSGYDAAVVNSFQFLSGMEDPNEIMARCPDGQDVYAYLGGAWGLLIVLVLFIPAIALICVGLVAVCATPIGVAVSLFGALAQVLTLGRSGRGGLALGLSVATTGLGAVVASGLILRFYKVVTTGSIACGA